MRAQTGAYNRRGLDHGKNRFSIQRFPRARIDLFGVQARAFGIVKSAEGRILNQRIGASRQISAHQLLVVSLRFDDRFRNGRESFAITADLYDSRVKREGGRIAGVCLHDKIARHFPELAHLIQWHLCSTDGPAHYIPNTAYWLGLRGWCDGKPNSPPNLQHARNVAIWPDMPAEYVATDPQSIGIKALSEKVEAALTARLPALLDRFKAAMLACGFEYPQA